MVSIDSGRNNADNQSIGSQRKNQDSKENDITCFSRFAAAEGGLCEGVYIDTKKTEFSFEKGCKGSSRQWI